MALDEAGNAGAGSPPDPDWPGMGEAREKADRKLKIPTIHDVRQQVLWGTLMAGGTGVEYYFGYQLPENDLNCEDWRSRDKTWDYSRIALDFFRDARIPFWEMQNANDLIGNLNSGNDGYCLARPGKEYLVYLAGVKDAAIDLSGAGGSFNVQWFNPREGGRLTTGSVAQVKGGGKAALGNPPADPDQDWVVVIR